MPKLIKPKLTEFNLKIVIFLFVMTGIPAIPGLYILASVLVGVDSMGQASSVVNPLYFDQPLIIILHAGSGMLFFLAMPLQFAGGLRLKFPKFHKISGHVAVSSGCIMGVSGVWMHYFLNKGVIDLRYLSLCFQGLCLCVAFFLAIKHILNRNIPSHRKWMSRAIAIALSLVTLVFIELILWLILGEKAQNNRALIQWLHNFGNLLGMAINLFVVQISLTRSGLKPQSSNHGSSIS
ncbi:MAG: DUF2306 domain-containing protein [Marinicellaceae bacterium]